MDYGLWTMDYGLTHDLFPILDVDAAGWFLSFHYALFCGKSILEAFENFLYAVNSPHAELAAARIEPGSLLVDGNLVRNPFLSLVIHTVLAFPVFIVVIGNLSDSDVHLLPRNLGAQQIAETRAVKIEEDVTEGHVLLDASHDGAVSFLF